MNDTYLWHREGLVGPGMAGDMDHRHANQLVHAPHQLPPVQRGEPMYYSEMEGADYADYCEDAGIFAQRSHVRDRFRTQGPRHGAF